MEVRPGRCDLSGSRDNSGVGRLRIASMWKIGTKLVLEYL